MQFKGNVSTLAEICDIHSPTIHNYLNGKYAPKDKNLDKIAKGLGINKEWLFSEDFKQLIGGIQEEKIQEPIVEYKGLERRQNWLYTPEEQQYIDMLLEILRGENKDNRKAIIENIKAFHKTRNITGDHCESKKATGA